MADGYFLVYASDTSHHEVGPLATEGEAFDAVDDNRQPDDKVVAIIGPIPTGSLPVVAVTIFSPTRPNGNGGNGGNDHGNGGNDH